MRGRNPLRFLAPIALLAFCFALYTVVKDARDSPEKTTSSQVPTPTSTSTSSHKHSKSKSKSKPTTYVVKSGDTPSGIAAKTGVALAHLQKLNKDFNPQSLTPGQHIRLRLSK
jgi:LysM repeat protein